MFTTVRNEAGAQIDTVSKSFSADGTSAPIPTDYYDYIVSALLTPASRSDAVLSSGYYTPAAQGDDTARNALEKVLVTIQY